MGSQRLMDNKALFDSLANLAARADDFGGNAWAGPARVELERAIIFADFVLSQAIDLPADAEGLRQAIQSNCRTLLAALKTTRLSVAHFDVDSRIIGDSCRRMLSTLQANRG